MSDGVSTYVEESRREKLLQLRDLDVEPFSYSYNRTHTASEALAAYSADDAAKVRIAGRVASLRRHGKTTFAHVEDASGTIQVYFRRDDLPDSSYEVVKLLDLGDFVGVAGKTFKTKTGEITIRVEKLSLLAKAVRPLPLGKTDFEGEQHGSLIDSETRHRRRYVDLAVHPDVRNVFRTRARTIACTREFLDQRGFLEVETPILQPLYGGAMANPFTTYQDTLGSKLYLRIATELYLKRLIVGGIEKVYEIGKNFRNEGIDRFHNPEFTMLEFYEAYADYHDMMDITEDLVVTITEETCGSRVIERFGKSFDFDTPWRRAGFTELVSQHAGIDIHDSDPEELANALIEEGRDAEQVHAMPRAKLIDEVFKIFVEPKLVQPTFVLDHPIELSPLAKAKRGDSRLAERFELFVHGKELANAFSELNDPEDQRRRFEAQAAARAAGDTEAQQMDEDYIRALEYGMPPTGGCGVGIDRLVMLLTEQNTIRDVILFPLLRSDG